MGAAPCARPDWHSNLQFTTASGNTADDQTHLETWELMRQLVGSSDFLYVADCKLASTDNLRTIDSRGGRFVTVELESYAQATPGRPGANTQYIKKVESRYDLKIDLDLNHLADALATDGIFPLITNADQMSAEEVLRAYKRQPLIEKRFSQFKHDFEVAPVYLKDVSRIQSLLCGYCWRGGRNPRMTRTRTEKCRMS
ncbi:transposase [Pirellulales bacterium]|nr:transposase [Pirellulales bacterium]